MSEAAFRVIMVGVGATMVMDLWALMLRHVYGVSGLDYRMVGRWLGHLMLGRIRHDGIALSAPMPGEAPIGWMAHYGIGISFAGGFIALAGADWLRMPTILPALLAGLVTVAAPYFVMQPAFGLGIAASRAPNPTAARLRSLVTHLVFGCGLYVAARLVATI
ncbi:MAG: DUF2938 domain-containing protein [Ferrovibrio sp.]